MLERIDQECETLRMGRSEFMAELAMMYFNDPVREERVKRLDSAAVVGGAKPAATPVKMARQVPFRRR